MTRKCPSPESLGTKKESLGTEKENKETNNNDKDHNNSLVHINALYGF